MCLSQVDGSPYGGQAYCEQFPRNSSFAYHDALAAAKGNTSALPFQYWAQVGAPSNPRYNFDNIFQAVVTVFQILTCDSWASAAYYAMSKVSPWAVLYYVIVICVGSFM